MGADCRCAQRTFRPFCNLTYVTIMSVHKFSSFADGNCAIALRSFGATIHHMGPVAVGYVEPLFFIFSRASRTLQVAT